MSSALLLTLLATTGITYQWREVQDAHGGHEYVVTVEPELMQAAVDGRAKTFQSSVPAHVEKVRRVVIVMGKGEPESLDHRLTETTEQPRLHSAKRPELAPEFSDPKRYVVRQQGYNNQAALEDGFRAYNNTAAQPRKSIGTEVAKGFNKVTGETKRVLQDTGEAIEGTARNTRDSLKSLLNPGSNQPAPPNPNAYANNGYTPYSYAQPTTPPPYGASPAYNGGSAAPTSPVTPAASNNSQWSNPTPPLPTTPAANPYANPNTPAPNYTPQPNSQPASQQPPAYNNNSYAAGGNQYNTPPTPGNGQGESFVNFAPPRGNAPNNPGDLAPLNPTTPNYPPATPPQQQQPSTPPPTQPAWPTTPLPTNPNSVAGANPNDSSGWPAWPTNPPASNGANPQTVGYNGANAGGTPGNQGYAGNQNQQNGYTPIGGPSSLDPPGGPEITDPNADSEKQRPESFGWLPLMSVAAIGSIAWNFYLGMNYIDARKKYRDALRRSGRAYSDAYDDA